MKTILQVTLGLSLREQKLLDALKLLKIAASVSKIAGTAALPRSTTLFLLRKFEKRNLARRITVGKRTRWMYDRKLNYVDDNLDKLKKN